MALKITKASDPISVEQLVVCIYGAPGVGKSSMGFTAENPLLFDFDAGAYRSANRGDSVPVRAWSDVANIAAADLAEYRTIVVDTAGRALDLLAADIIARDPKAGRGGALSLQGYGKLKTEFAAWLKLIRSFGADVVLLAHADEQRSGDEVIERIDAQGGSKNEIYKCSDAMGRLAIREGKRVLLFSPTDTAFGKNPAQLEPLTVPRFDERGDFLGDVIRTIKTRLNDLTAEQKEVARITREWREQVAACVTPAALNSLVAISDSIDPRARENAKRILLEHAKSSGFKFDKKAGGFVEREEAVAV